MFNFALKKQKPQVNACGFAKNRRGKMKKEENYLYYCYHTNQL